jgi:DNA-binding HxlR family transcriptional regulator
LDLFGDRWTLLILRDMIFGGKRYYSDFLEAGEGISTNVLAERLNRLEEAALISKRRDPEDGKRSVYALTEKGLDTLPILLEMVAWGASYDPATGAPAEFTDRFKQDRDGVLAEFRARANL